MLKFTQGDSRPGESESLSADVCLAEQKKKKKFKKNGTKRKGEG